MTDIDGIEISQRGSLLPYRVCYPLGRKHGRYRAAKRRNFIAMLGGMATWPLAARAQPPKRMLRVGVLLSATADDLEFQARVGAFAQELRQLGWSIWTECRDRDAMGHF